jgi:ribulose-phosphate 3-epimerase
LRAREAESAAVDVEVAASILTADFGNLYRVVRKLEKAGVDRLHLDVMDGHFVPNITFGSDVVAAFRRLTKLPLDAHLMISEPARYVSRFLDAGADSITFHVEVNASEEEKRETLQRIGAAGRQPGLAVSPETAIDRVRPFADDIAIVMIMTVHPGFGGQRFIAEAAPKIAEARELMRDRPDANIHVDGGVSSETAEVVGGYGVNVCVVGSALFQRGHDAAREVEAVKMRARLGAMAAPPTASSGTATARAS